MLTTEERAEIIRDRLRERARWHKEVDLVELKRVLVQKGDAGVSNQMIGAAVRKLGDRVNKRVEREWGLARTWYIYRPTPEEMDAVRAENARQRERAEEDHARTRRRARQQRRVIEQSDAEAEARGITSDGALRPGYYMRLLDWAEKSKRWVLNGTDLPEWDRSTEQAVKRLREINLERQRLERERLDLMEGLREFEDMAVQIDRARGLGGRGW